MGNTWYSCNSRPRNRLRKRKNSPYHLGLYRLSKYYSGRANKDGSYDRDRILNSGFTVGETWGCLEKAWVGFRAAKRLENDKDMKLYASIIQRLEKELKIEVDDFPELGLCACDQENKDEKDQDNDYSKLGVINPWSDEKMQEIEENEDDYREVNFDSL